MLDVAQVFAQGAEIVLVATVDVGTQSVLERLEIMFAVISQLIEVSFLGAVVPLAFGEGSNPEIVIPAGGKSFVVKIDDGARVFGQPLAVAGPIFVNLVGCFFAPAICVALLLSLFPRLLPGSFAAAFAFLGLGRGQGRKIRDVREFGEG